MKLNNIVENAVEWVRARPVATAIYTTSAILAGLGAYNILKESEIGDGIVYGLFALVGLATGMRQHRRESHEYHLYMQIGRVIETQGFDNVVFDDDLRPIAKSYAKRNGRIEEYESALLRLSVKYAQFN
ncbi:hypothetical protein HYV49_06385 [Candidatus Pacearchaeota archaeon]|nr:hypothetical protein [Candidatus Pacearchaeota archaeon]